MPAADGSPTFVEKLFAPIGLGPAIGMTPEEVTATVAGDKADLTKDEQAIATAATPILNLAENDGISDLINVLDTLITLIPGVSSISGFVQIVTTVLAAENGPLAAQAKAIGQTALTTLATTALTAAGKVNLPVA
jgi:hypothetical protein